MHCLDLEPIVFGLRPTCIQNSETFIVAITLELKELSCSRSTKGSLRHLQSFGVAAAPVLGLGSILIRSLLDPGVHLPGPFSARAPYEVRIPPLRVGAHFCSCGIHSSGLTDPTAPFPLFEGDRF